MYLAHYTTDDEESVVVEAPTPEGNRLGRKGGKRHKAGQNGQG